MVYMLGLLPFFLRILMEVTVTTRKTAPRFLGSMRGLFATAT